MDQRYFAVPFAVAGDQTAISETVDPTGVVSFPQGWGPNYARDQATDPLAIPIDRATTNYLFSVITVALAALQRTGIPEWITPANNDGVALPYMKNAQVRYSATSPGVTFETYVSLVDNNTAVPGSDATKWQPISQFVASAAQLTAGTDNRAIVTPLGLASQTALRALLAGSASQVFSVANASAATHAVNLGQINALTPGKLARRTIFINVGTTANIQCSVDGGAFFAQSTWQALSGVTRVQVQCQAAGGGGGGTPATGVNQACASPGGGGGSYCFKTFLGASIPTGTVNIGVGIGGLGGNGVSGFNGTSSSFGSLLATAGGAGGGAPSPLAGTQIQGGTVGGAVAVGGDINIAGQPALGSWSIAGGRAVAGSGANSTFGAGGCGQQDNTSGSQSTGFGSGGPGRAVGASVAALTGGNGTNGIVIIEEFI